jgi:LysR family transcriptional regulator, nitrogen assimilation regulatory protein
MQFRQLRYFVKIVEAGSFSRAATLIHVAQPALSQQIHELEDRLGVMLLQRSARGVSPTAAGEVLFREATSILHQLDQLPTVVRSTSGEAEGAVKVGLASSTAPILIGPLLERVKTTLPKVNLKISDDDSGTLQAASPRAVSIWRLSMRMNSCRASPGGRFSGSGFTSSAASRSTSRTPHLPHWSRSPSFR